MAWLSILAARNESVEQILKSHWARYGRNFFTRYDYEDCAGDPCAKMMSALEQKLSESSFVGTVLGSTDKTFVVATADNFSYADPVDQSLASGQGLRIVFSDGSRIIFRLSGTGSSGATVRLYVDSFEADPSKHLLDAQVII